MHEFDSVSVSTYEASSLAAKLTAKSSEGWDVVAIVPTGSDITAFLRRADATEAAATETPAAAADAVAAATTEPAGWGSAPAASTTGSSWGSDAGTASAYGTAASSGDDTGSTWGSSTSTPAAAAPAAAAASTPSVPPGWYADPAGRYELRYWDGTAWTEHVSRAGQQYTDPPVA
jgi:hypothetical protein